MDMALSAFDGVLTAAQIVAAARRRAGSPDLQLDPTSGLEVLTAPAYVELQMLLDHLALAWDWPFARIARSIPLLSRTVTLPTEFWRVSINDSMWVVDCNGDRTRPIHDDEDVFFDRITTPLTLVARPERWFIQKSS